MTVPNLIGVEEHAYAMLHDVKDFNTRCLIMWLFLFGLHGSHTDQSAAAAAAAAAAIAKLDVPTSIAQLRNLTEN